MVTRLSEASAGPADAASFSLPAASSLSLVSGRVASDAKTALMVQRALPLAVDVVQQEQNLLRDAQMEGFFQGSNPKALLDFFNATCTSQEELNKLLQQWTVWANAYKKPTGQIVREFCLLVKGADLAIFKRMIQYLHEFAPSRPLSEKIREFSFICRSTASVFIRYSIMGMCFNLYARWSSDSELTLDISIDTLQVIPSYQASSLELFDMSMDYLLVIPSWEASKGLIDFFGTLAKRYIYKFLPEQKPEIRLFCKRLFKNIVSEIRSVPLSYKIHGDTILLSFLPDRDQEMYAQRYTAVSCAAYSYDRDGEWTDFLGRIGELLRSVPKQDIESFFFLLILTHNAPFLKLNPLEFLENRLKEGKKSIDEITTEVAALHRSHLTAREKSSSSS